MVTNGEARVVFGADGGVLEVRSVTVASVTAEVFILAENGAESTLSGSTVQSCQLTSVTDTRTGANQQVLDTSVSSMQDLEDAFIGTGTNTRVFLTRTSVVNNLLRERWRVLAVRDSAHGRAQECTIARNTALQFGFTASSSDSVMLIDDSFFEDNVGLGVSETLQVMYCFLRIILHAHS